MHDNLSPYALLQASKPKKSGTVTTVYDLYSAAHSYQAQPAAPSNEQNIQERVYSANDRQTAPAPIRRTHYISDIQKRHNAAMRRSTLY